MSYETTRQCYFLTTAQSIAAAKMTVVQLDELSYANSTGMVIYRSKVEQWRQPLYCRAGLEIAPASRLRGLDVYYS
jgi:hypothetical protein